MSKRTPNQIIVRGQRRLLLGLVAALATASFSPRTEAECDPRPPAYANIFTQEFFAERDEGLLSPLPCGVDFAITSAYSCSSSAKHYGTNHYALDYAFAAGDDLPEDHDVVVAVAAGEVVFAGWMSREDRYTDDMVSPYGRMVMIRHRFEPEREGVAGEAFSLYAHLSELLLSDDELARIAGGEPLPIAAGRPIGRVGGSGRAKGTTERREDLHDAHLHFSLMTPGWSNRVDGLYAADGRFVGGPYGMFPIEPEPIGGLSGITAGGALRSVAADSGHCATLEAIGAALAPGADDDADAESDTDDGASASAGSGRTSASAGTAAAGSGAASGSVAGGCQIAGDASRSSIASSLALALALLGLVAGFATRRRAALVALAALAMIAGLAGCSGGPLPSGDGSEPTRGAAQADGFQPGYYRLQRSYGVDPQPCVYSGNQALCYRSGLERFPHAWGVHRLIRESGYGSRLVGPDGQNSPPFYAAGGGALSSIWLPSENASGEALHERLGGFTRPVNFLPTTEHGDKFVVVLHDLHPGDGEAHPRVALVERDGDRDVIVGVLPTVLGRKSRTELGQASPETPSWTPVGEAQIYRMVVSRNMTPMPGSGAWELPGVGFDMYIEPRDGARLEGPRDYYGVALHAAWWWWWSEDEAGQARASTLPLDTTRDYKPLRPHQLDAWNDVTYSSHGCINLPDKSWHGIGLRRLHGDGEETTERVSAAELLFKWALSGISGDRYTVDADASPTSGNCLFPRSDAVPARGVDDCALSQPLPVFIARDLEHLATMRHPAGGANVDASHWSRLIGQISSLPSRSLLWSDSAGELVSVSDASQVTSHEAE